MNNSRRKLNALRKLKLLQQSLEALAIVKEAENRKRKRSCSVREINRDRNRNGFFVVSYLAMKNLDEGQFFIYTRMTKETYQLLTTLISPFISKSSIREAISPECRIAVVLQYLAQGTPIQTLAWSFKLGKETVRSILLETCEMLWTILHPVYVSEPNHKDYTETADDFWNLWGMPNCVGAIDGKHIAIRCPPKSGSQYFCYKKFFSIVLLAGCDAKYRFTFVDVGAYGSQSDGGIFQCSRFGKRLLENKLPIPAPKQLPNSNVVTPHYFVADAAFPLSENIMRPYPGVLLPREKENFNFRLSRGRRTIENSFGILVARWRILQTTINMLPENAECVVLACVALHNFIMFNRQESMAYCSDSYIDWEDDNGILHDGIWRNEIGNMLPSVNPSPSSNHYGGRYSIEIRNRLCRFLNENS